MSLEMHIEQMPIRFMILKMESFIRHAEGDNAPSASRSKNRCIYPSRNCLS